MRGAPKTLPVKDAEFLRVLLNALVRRQNLLWFIQPLISRIVKYFYSGNHLANARFPVMARTCILKETKLISGQIVYILALVGRNDLHRGFPPIIKAATIYDLNRDNFVRFHFKPDSLVVEDYWTKSPKEKEALPGRTSLRNPAGFAESSRLIDFFAVLIKNLSLFFLNTSVGTLI